ncbi:MAG: MFS transporter, partial [Terrimicrobiaceae bacterium]
MTPGTGKVPLGQKLAWGLGGLADNFMMNAVVTLIMPIYNIGFGVSAIWLGVATAIPRFLDALTDPVMGGISDSTTSRWGRRRPYILAGTVLCALLFPLLWMPPFAGETGRLIWFFAIYVIFTLAYTVYVVPYTALGIELTTDYDERTRVMAWRMILGLLGSIAVPWIYLLTRLDVFGGNEVVGIRPVSLLIAVAILACGLPPALMVRERTFEQSGAKFDFREGLRLVLGNRPFLLLLFAYVVILCGLFVGGSFGLYVNIFHVFGGDKTAAATISGIAGTVTAGAAYASIFLATWTATHFGKKTAMLWGLGLGTLGGASMWFTMTPSAPYAQLISAALIGLGLQGCWLMVSSMTADICDLDELQTGLRREGLFSALVGFVQKAAFALIAL